MEGGHGNIAITEIGPYIKIGGKDVLRSSCVGYNTEETS